MGTCVALTDHSFGRSLVERPGQRQSFGKMLQLQQAVDPLDGDTLETGTHQDRPIYTALRSHVYPAHHQTYLPPGPEGHDVSRLQH